MQRNELSALARQFAPQALAVLSYIANDPKANRRDRASARRELQRRHSQFVRLAADQDLPADVRNDVENALRVLTRCRGQ
jgi:hypothetical protein